MAIWDRSYADGGNPEPVAKIIWGLYGLPRWGHADDLFVQLMWGPYRVHIVLINRSHIGPTYSPHIWAAHMGPILSPWPKLSGARMGYPYGPHVQAHMGPMWDMYGHVGWVASLKVTGNSTNR